MTGNHENFFGLGSEFFYLPRILQAPATQVGQSHNTVIPANTQQLAGFNPGRHVVPGLAVAEKDNISAIISRFNHVNFAQTYQKKPEVQAAKIQPSDNENKLNS